MGKDEVGLLESVLIALQNLDGLPEQSDKDVT